MLACRGKLGHACLKFLFLCDGLGTSCDEEISPFFRPGVKAVHASRAEPLLFVVLGAKSGQGVLHSDMSGQARARVLDISVSLRWAGCLWSKGFSFFRPGKKPCTRPGRNLYFLNCWGQTSGQGVLHFHMSGQARARVRDIFVSLRWVGYL